MTLNGMPSAVTRVVRRIACTASHQGVGAGKQIATKLCTPLDAKRHQRSSGAVKPPGQKHNSADRLILMGVSQGDFLRGNWRDSSPP